VLLGFRMLTTPRRTEELREKRLEDYQTFAPPGALPTLEIPRPPDMVFLSGMFGILSLTSPLVSSLLLAMLFGPAALVCGVVALCQGHLKGLIGVVLGVAGLIVWGAVSLYVFRG
jgi:hypothetical protein